MGTERSMGETILYTLKINRIIMKKEVQIFTYKLPNVFTDVKLYEFGGQL